VLVQNGLSQTELGKMILAACFVSDFGMVLAFFANFNRWMLLFVGVVAVMLYFLPA
jgi:hypothetical protein